MGHLKCIVPIRNTNEDVKLPDGIWNFNISVHFHVVYQTSPGTRNQMYLINLEDKTQETLERKW